jgi:hypothetical protein
VGTTSPPQTITVTNSSASDTITINEISLSGSNHADYSQTNHCAGALNPLASCSVTVSFTPSHTGVRTANVKVQDSNAGGSPQYVSLTGTGQ